LQLNLRINSPFMHFQAYSVRLAVLMLAMFFHVNAISQQTEERDVREMDYLLYHPPGYAKDTTKIWPMRVYLDGAGETGHHLETLNARGLPGVITGGRNFPFIVVSPHYVNSDDPADSVVIVVKGESIEFTAPAHGGSTIPQTISAYIMIKGISTMTAGQAFAK